MSDLQSLYGRSAHEGLTAAQSALEAVLRSRSFAGAERRKRLLEYLVTQTISGQGSSLKEFNIGVELYGRDPATYDPRIDPVVRVDIGRLRTKLKEYYAAEGRNDPLRIELPKGSYAVAFHDPDGAALSSAAESLVRIEPALAEQIPLPKPSERRERSPHYAALVAVMVVLLAVAYVVVYRRTGAPAAKHQPDPEAYSLLIKARALRGDGTRQTFDQAVTYLHQAIGRDPNFAQAYSALAGVYAS